ncbi:MAG: FAD-binding oxidoreductase, partial [Pseudomonadota bacterium]
ARGLRLVGGRVTGVVTEAGTIAAPQVILAGGAWSSLFLRRHNVSIPQLSVRASVAATGPLPQSVAVAGADPDFAFRPRADGGYTLAAESYSELFVGADAVRNAPRYLRSAFRAGRKIRFRPAAPRGYPDAWTTPRRWADGDESPFERMRILDPTPAAGKLSEVRRRFGQVFPSMAPVPQARAWAGMIDVMPDLLPIVDRAEALPGLIVATGMSGHGFGIGPAYGRILADMVTGGDPGHDLTPFRLSRFRDGSRVRPAPPF